MIADDLKFGWRQLIKAPGFTITAVLTLGLAIGANTAVFSLVDAVLLKALPYPNPERLATVRMIVTRDGAVVGENNSHTGKVWEAIRDHATTFDAAVLSGLAARISLVLPDRAVVITPQRVSAGYFRVLGVPPAMGREFTREEDRVGGPAVTVLSDRLWRSAFDGDPSVLGRTVLLKGEPHEVIGIMPPSFRSSVDADLWTPIRPNTNGEGASPNYGIIARLKDGATWPQAGAEVAVVADPAVNPREGTTGRHVLLPLQDALAQSVRLPLLLLSAAVGLVLAVACVNLAGLLLARASRRTREIATRLAIGGDRRAVMRQLLIESILLAICGGVFGLIVGAVALEGLKATATDLLLTPWGQVSLDARVLSVTLGLTMLTAVLFGLVPALQATRLDVQAALAEGGTRSVAGGARGWPRRVLVIAEVALGVVLLVGAGLLIRTFVHLQTRPPGFDPRHVIVATVSLDDARYAQHAGIEQLFERSLARIQAIPGVESAAVSLGLPYERILNMGARIVQPSGQPSDFVFSTATYVTPGYFETLRLPILRGRPFSTADTTTSAPAVIVNEVFARRYFKDRDAVGEYVTMSGATRQIVGVAANVQQRGGFQDFGPIDALPAIYMPFAQFPGGGLRTIHGWFSTAWIIRQGRDGAVTEQVLRRAMADVDGQLALSPIRGVDDVRAAALTRQRVLMWLVAALGGLALFLAAIGIHALIASGVAERTRELGIRMALGATVRQTVIDAARPGIIMAIVGVAIGCALAAGASGLIRNLLWGVRENDPLTFAAVVAALLAVAVTASVLPALRVRKFDPVTLLRSE
ncbi:MAG TPA: ABC transporter permease [Vicinamibacterales bacterium]